MQHTPTRRTFLQGAALLGAGSWLSTAHGQDPSSERLRVGVVGVGGRGGANLGGVSSQDVVALCDVDASFLERAAQGHPKAARYADFRKMLDGEKLDAVVVSTPDHTHAQVTVAALAAGCHVYCEKPLTHTVREARVVAELAREKGLVTQMGTQIHAGANYRRVVELVRARVIGDVQEVHVFCGKSWGADGPPTGEGEEPAHLDWDLWLGGAAERPYQPGLHPANWRRYWDFGGGTLGDMACHYMDLPFWALDLWRPTSVEAWGPAVNAHAAPREMKVTWTFPERGERAPVAMSWYDGARRPERLKELGREWGSGVLFVGTEGDLLADYGRYELLPAEKFEGVEPDRSIPDSVGHYREWIEAVRGGGRTTCDFRYSGALSETVLLGNVAFRAGRKLEWDGDALTVRGDEEATRLVRGAYREGWEI